MHLITFNGEKFITNIFKSFSYPLTLRASVTKYGCFLPIRPGVITRLDAILEAPPGSAILRYQDFPLGYLIRPNGEVYYVRHAATTESSYLSLHLVNGTNTTLSDDQDTQGMLDAYTDFHRKEFRTIGFGEEPCIDYSPAIEIIAETEAVMPQSLTVFTLEEAIEHMRDMPMIAIPIERISFGSKTESRKRNNAISIQE